MILISKYFPKSLTQNTNTSTPLTCIATKCYRFSRELFLPMASKLLQRCKKHALQLQRKISWKKLQTVIIFYVSMHAIPNKRTKARQNLTQQCTHIRIYRLEFNLISRIKNPLERERESAITDWVYIAGRRKIEKGVNGRLLRIRETSFSGLP